MKKLLILLLIIMTLVSCNTTTTTTQDLMMLQQKYPNSIIYRATNDKYLIIDSLQVQQIEVSNSGKITTVIKIK